MNDKIICLVDDLHGIYVPQTFAEQISGIGPENVQAWGISPEDNRTLLSGPETPDYWETWDDILRDAKRTIADGSIYHLQQSGHLFAVLEGWCLECNLDRETCMC